MTGTSRQRGFSLTEVLLATGVLAVGFAMIATVFPVGMMLTSAAVERSIGPVAAQEAEAKVRLYGVNWSGMYWALNQGHMKVYNWGPGWTGTAFTPPENIIDTTVYTSLDTILTPQGITPASRLFEESFYPSLPEAYYVQNPQESRKYRWTVLGRRTGLREFRMVAFICRKTAEGAKYYGYTDYDPLTDVYTVTPQASLEWPMPVRVRVETTGAANEIRIQTDTQQFALAACEKFFTEDCRIVDDKNGRIYRVLERKDDATDGLIYNEILVLDHPWLVDAAVTEEAVWVVPPARGSGRNPCIGIYPFTTITD